MRLVERFRVVPEAAVLWVLTPGTLGTQQGNNRHSHGVLWVLTRVIQYCLQRRVSVGYQPPLQRPQPTAWVVYPREYPWSTPVSPTGYACREYPWSTHPVGSAWPTSTDAVETQRSTWHWAEAFRFPRSAAQRGAVRCGVRCGAVRRALRGLASPGRLGGRAGPHAPAVEAAAVDVRDVRQPVLYGAHPWQLGVVRLVRPRGRSRRGRASRHMHGTERRASRALRQRPTWKRKSKPPGPVGLSTRITSSAIRLHSSHFSFGTCGGVLECVPAQSSVRVWQRLGRRAEVPTAQRSAVQCSARVLGPGGAAIGETQCARLLWARRRRFGPCQPSFGWAVHISTGCIALRDPCDRPAATAAWSAIRCMVACCILQGHGALCHGFMLKYCGMVAWLHYCCMVAWLHYCGVWLHGCVVALLRRVVAWLRGCIIAACGCTLPAHLRRDDGAEEVGPVLQELRTVPLEYPASTRDGSPSHPPGVRAFRSGCAAQRHGIRHCSTLGVVIGLGVLRGYSSNGVLKGYSRGTAFEPCTWSHVSPNSSSPKKCVTTCTCD